MSQIAGDLCNPDTVLTLQKLYSQQIECRHILVYITQENAEFHRLYIYFFFSSSLLLLQYDATLTKCCTLHDNPYVQTQTAKRGAKFHLMADAITPFCCIWRCSSGACVFYQLFNFSLPAKPQRGQVQNKKFLSIIIAVSLV